jgi:steroid 5-alpha reductase family enzyme
VTPLALSVAGPGRVLPLAALVVVLLMTGVWLLSIRLHDVSIIDPVWGPALALVGVVGLAAGDGSDARRGLLAAMVVLWGGRLGWHLTMRKRHEPEEDRRYAVMREKQGDRFVLWSLRMVFGTQALLVLVVSLPLSVSAQVGGDLGVLAGVGVLVWAVGLAFETIGDAQLRAFKADPASPGQVMDRGLWRYTRHPNYFGDACVWWGLWLVAVTASGVWWTAIGPAVMTLLLVRVSGAGLLEKDIGTRRPGYAEYIERTSGFVPLPPRRSRPAS